MGHGIIEGIIEGEQPTQFTYVNGNTASSNARSYAYDTSNRLTTVSENDTKLAEYVYNGLGQRIKRVTRDETRLFHYDLTDHLIAETDATGGLKAEYVFLGDQPLAMIGSDGKAYYFHTTTWGSVGP